jgi:hypothetical protein
MLAPRLLLYGPAKIGKTVAACAASHHGLMIAAAGALTPSQTHLGIPAEKLNIRQADTLSDVLKILSVESKRKWPVVYIDDLSLAIKRAQAGVKIDWRKFDGELNELGKYATDSMSNGVPFIITAHEQPDRTSSGKYVRGGPQLPGQAPEGFSGSIDVVLRGVSDETMQPWPFVVWSRSRKNWVAGDRLAIFPDMGPLNVAQGLRCSGVNIPYPEGWMGKAVAQWSVAIKEAGVGQWQSVVRPAFTKLAGKYDARYLKWAAIDALHSAVFEQRKNDPMTWLDGIGAVEPSLSDVLVAE